jgi:hypothetical protein
MTYRNRANVNPVDFSGGLFASILPCQGYVRLEALVSNEPTRRSLRGTAKCRRRPDYSFEANIFLRRRASSAASAKSQSRKVTILGFVEVALGQTIQ